VGDKCLLAWSLNLAPVDDRKCGLLFFSSGALVTKVILYPYLAYLLIRIPDAFEFLKLISGGGWYSLGSGMGFALTVFLL